MHSEGCGELGATADLGRPQQQQPQRKHRPREKLSHKEWWSAWHRKQEVLFLRLEDLWWVLRDSPISSSPASCVSL